MIFLHFIVTFEVDNFTSNYFIYFRRDFIVVFLFRLSLYKGWCDVDLNFNYGGDVDLRRLLWT